MPCCSRAFARSDTAFSPRLGALWQPDGASSYYVSFGTSYNTAGDTYQFAPGGPNQRTANTPPEKSRNLEIGAKWDAGTIAFSVAGYRLDRGNVAIADPNDPTRSILVELKP